MSEFKNISFIKSVMKKEAAAIEKSASALDADNVEKALKLLLECKGKIITIGVGKSGLVGRKISSTLTSIGIQSIFLHPDDALHGDLGIVSSDDIVIAISNSGESKEVTAIIPYIKFRKVKIIAILGNSSSTLASQADIVLNLNIDKEACPFNIVPTTSTTVALAFGDALALALMKSKDINPGDFALNHPAGRLGMRLSLRVCDIMHSNSDNPTILMGAAWYDVIRVISSGGLGAVSVIDDKGFLVGIITDGDIRRAIQKTNPERINELNTDNMMTPNPVTVFPDTLAYDALQLMENRKSQISVLPVIDKDKKCVGMVRLHDIIRSGL